MRATWRRIKIRIKKDKDSVIHMQKCYVYQNFKSFASLM